MMISCNPDTIKLTPILESIQLLKISDEEYFSSKYAGYISNSRLGVIDPEGENDPDAFFKGIPAKYSDALIFGSAVHELTLQPEAFELVDQVERTTAKLGFMHDFLYPRWLKGPLTETDVIEASNEINYYKGKMNDVRVANVLSSGEDYWRSRKEWEEKKPQKTPIYLDSKSRIRVKACIDSLNKNSEIQKLLHPEGLMNDPVSENEYAILLDVRVDIPDHEPFKIKLKSKLDNFTIDSETDTICVNDIKTIGKILSYFDDPINGNFNKFHYYRELAMYSWLLSLIAKSKYNIENPTITSNCLVVSTIPDYYTKVYKVTKRDFAKGWAELNQLLKLACRYVDDFKESSIFHTL